MNTVEDRLRRLCARPPAKSPRSPCRRWACTARAAGAWPAPRPVGAGWAWLAPLAAAASVTAVVAASLAISTAFHGGHRAVSGPTGPFAGVAV